ncbi:uncharacterized protein SPPG_08493 [Spizellomyces punctatus DAOM BR117]|uniref:Kinesin-like protein n=1 Tax=Spizellomyces punctatus (strain DAOM BR117) TaxID=645134 RepID=A0A0L0H574_SPIPD|nr:uncharacterized protein SPPG_08493 [Spizellomyces punctatus DAOM BR117]KNC96104.1 hypothetical protein SPPG_08493 [Spizellomyces punctatus DAOM BR117]|eukprot:XP_016604144.1 hypothetical protein SPPG_08493 [Spizellomyces punctatus DAOM BR117]
MDSNQNPSDPPPPTTTSLPPLTPRTIGRLKPPSKIAPMSVKPLSFTPKGDQNVDPDQLLTAEDFKVHTVPQKRKTEAPPPTSRNTRLKTDSSSSSSIYSGSVTARSTRTTTVTRNPPTRASTTRAPTKPTTTTTTTRSTTLKSKPSTMAKPVSKPAKPTPKDSDEPVKKKRPAWDVKGRLQDLEEYHHQTQSQLLDSQSQIANMTDELSRSRSTIDELIQFRQTLENQVHVKEAENSTFAQQVTELRAELLGVEKKYKDEIALLISRHAREIEEREGEIGRLKKVQEGLDGELRIAKEENITLRSTISTQSALSVSLESECRANKLLLEQTESTLRDRETRIQTIEQQLDASRAAVQALEAKVREEETVRRRLHNTIQELKGNIRVFCRVRPPLDAEKSEKPDEVLSHISFAEGDEQVIELRQAVESASGQKTVEKTYPFSFDRVFPPTTTQPQVFEEISQLVQSALDGYNVCIFAYGQTGSGKTFTMEGPSHALDDPDTMGMIPRAVHQIFDTATTLEHKGWTYEMEAQYLEIYNETIRDLIGGKEGKHEIKHLGSTTVVTDVVTVKVETPTQVHEVLRKASHNRAVAATNCNERSSRSHSVFTLRLKGTNPLTSESSSGTLNLIDLAGSERLSSSGSTGDRLRETQAINKSLSCLGDVISALSSGDKHVPYRNSRLTYLLQNSLGGNSKTLMFVNVSPLSGSFGETLCSLRFATKVNSCMIGSAKRVK